jgi:hypothetical protein
VLAALWAQRRQIANLLELHTQKQEESNSFPACDLWLYPQQTDRLQPLVWVPLIRRHRHSTFCPARTGKIPHSDLLCQLLLVRNKVMDRRVVAHTVPGYHGRLYLPYQHCFWEGVAGEGSSLYRGGLQQQLQLVCCYSRPVLHRLHLSHLLLRKQVIMCIHCC